jgi:hypothetical protein
MHSLVLDGVYVRKAGSAELHFSAARSGSAGLCGEVRGVNVHAGTSIDGRDRKRLQRLCRYIARPAISQERLTLLPDATAQARASHRSESGTAASIA